MHSSLKTISAAAVIGISTLSLSAPANAGWGCGWGCGWGPALAGFGLGAIVGSAIAAPPVYAGPPPPPYYYGPTAYGPPYYGPAYGPAGYGPPPGYYGHAYGGQAGYGPQSGYYGHDYDGQADYGADYGGQAAYGPPPRTPSGYTNRPYYPPANTPPHVTTDAQRTGTLPSATAKTGVTTTSKQKMEAKLKLAEAKAKRDGVASLTEEDLKGLSPEQIKQLRGY